MSNPTPFSVSGHTRPFAVLGHPIGHTLSPVMHNAALRGLGWDAIYLAFDVPPEDLMDVLRGMRSMGFEGVNLTIPHKEVAYRGVDHLGPSAELLGAVNTILFRKDGTLEGHCTDGYGISMALREAFDLGFADQRVLILGCGGAGRAAARVAADAGASEVLLANRTRKRAEDLAVALQSEFPDTTVRACAEWPPAPTETQAVDIVLQSTSVGLKAEDVSPLDASHFRQGQVLIDMTYAQQVTPVMRAAREAGARAENGLGMLLHQGVKSFELWTGETPPVDLMRDALRLAVYGESTHV